MSSAPVAPSENLNPLPTAQQLATASGSELRDKDGQSTTFGAVTAGKRTVVVFVRHFWCGACQLYVSELSSSLPALPDGTSLIVIGCGDAAPIAQYAKDTSCSFPIYANPDLSLYNLFGFSENLIMVPKEQGGGYGAALGSKWTRIWSYLRDGPLRSPGLIGTTGPVSQNGGEMILEAEGTCSFFHRMEHTADHTEVADLAKVIASTPSSAAA